VLESRNAKVRPRPCKKESDSMNVVARIDVLRTDLALGDVALNQFGVGTVEN
jgi:hypothetical protein